MDNAGMWRQIGIVGAGRVAEAFALALASHSTAPVLVFDTVTERCVEFVQRIGRAKVAPDATSLTQLCDLILIAVPDDWIGQVASQLAAAGPLLASSFVFHVSGKCSLAALEPLVAAGALAGAIHPVMTFTGHPAVEAARLRESWLAVTTATAPAHQHALAVVMALGGRAFTLPDAMRPLYHAALAHVANHMVTLVADAAQLLSVAGVAAPREVMAPIVRAALENALGHGFAALSGPLLRGDAGTISAHLAAIDNQAPDIADSYRANARATLRQMEANTMGDGPTREALRTLVIG